MGSQKDFEDSFDHYRTVNGSLRTLTELAPACMRLTCRNTERPLVSPGIPLDGAKGEPPTHTVNQRSKDNCSPSHIRLGGQPSESLRPEATEVHPESTLAVE